MIFIKKWIVRELLGNWIMLIFMWDFMGCEVCYKWEVYVYRIVLFGNVKWIVF